MTADEIRDRLADVFKDDVLYFHGGLHAQDPRTVKSAPLSWFKPRPHPDHPDRFLEVAWAASRGSEGRILARANFESLWDNESWKVWENDDGDAVTLRGYEAWGAFALLVNLDAATIDQLDELEQTLEALERYPVVSDQRLTELEFRAAEQSYRQFIRREFRSELYKRFDHVAEVDPADADLDRLFWAVLARVQHEWIPAGSSAYLSPSAQKIARLPIVEELPEFWGLFPSGYDHGFLSCSYNAGQTLLPVAVRFYALPTWPRSPARLGVQRSLRLHLHPGYIADVPELAAPTAAGSGLSAWQIPPASSYWATNISSPPIRTRVGSVPLTSVDDPDSAGDNIDREPAAGPSSGPSMLPPTSVDNPDSRVETPDVGGVADTPNHCR